MSMACQAKIFATRSKAIPAVAAISIPVEVEEEDNVSVRKFMLEIALTLLFFGANINAMSSRHRISNKML